MWQQYTVDDHNQEFIALKEKVSTNEVIIYFFWRDTDKIKSAKHGRHIVLDFEGEGDRKKEFVREEIKW